MKGRTVPVGLVAEETVTAEHRRRLEYNRERNNPPQPVIQVSCGLPQSSKIKLVAETDRRHNLPNVPPVGRDVTSHANDTDVFAIEVLLSTRLSEFASPERLVRVDSKPKSFEFRDDQRDTVCGDNDIVPIDAHLSHEGLNVLS